MYKRAISYIYIGSKTPFARSMQQGTAYTQHHRTFFVYPYESRQLMGCKMMPTRRERQANARPRHVPPTKKHKIGPERRERSLPCKARKHSKLFFFPVHGCSGESDLRDPVACPCSNGWQPRMRAAIERARHAHHLRLLCEPHFHIHALPHTPIYHKDLLV